MDRLLHLGRTLDELDASLGACRPWRNLFGTQGA
jgi:hypothetical protein